MAKRTTPRAQAADTATADAPKVRRSRASETIQSLPPDGEPQSSPVVVAPSEEDIRMRAYHRYLERGGGDGMDFEDWLEAENELRRKSEV